MINGLSSAGKFTYIHGGHSSGPNVNMSNPSAGMVRFNGNYFEVYNGYNWSQITGTYPQIGLQPDAEQAIEWVLKKMQRESELKELAKTSKAVKLSIEKRNQAEEELELLLILAKEHDTETTS